MSRTTGKESNKLKRILSEAMEGRDNEDKKANIIITPNFRKLLYGMLKGYRVVSLEGGARSGKTYAALQWIVFASLDPKKFLPNFDKNRLVTRCMRKEAANAYDSIWKDLRDILDTLGIKDGENGFKCNKQRLTWTFPNGSEIIFGGANDEGRLHGLGQDIVFFNEVMQIPKSMFDQANYRTRIGFILDWNPSLNSHWVFKIGLDKISNYGKDELPELVGKPKCLWIHSTYKDNYDVLTGKSNLTPYQIAGIEQYEPTPGNIDRGTADRVKWAVYGLGIRGVLEGRIIPGEKVTIVDDKDFPTKNQWQMHGYGLDWGFSDPTTLVECAIFNNKLYVRELIYETELVMQADKTMPEQRSIMGLIKQFGVPLNEPIVADNARPEMIKALRNAGYLVIAADKIAGSIENGINLMNSRRWCVTDSSYNIKMELENYVWQETRYGEKKTKPVDKWNHAMDAIRYWVTAFITSGNNLTYDAVRDGENTDRQVEVEYGCAMPDYFL